MAWYRQATKRYPSPCWPRSMSPYGVTRPQSVDQLISLDTWDDTIKSFLYPWKTRVNCHDNQPPGHVIDLFLLEYARIIHIFSPSSNLASNSFLAYSFRSAFPFQGVFHDYWPWSLMASFDQKWWWHLTNKTKVLAIFNRKSVSPVGLVP